MFGLSTKSIVILVAVILVLGVSFFVKKQLQVQYASLPPTSFSQEKPPMLKTYRNDSYDFEVRYNPFQVSFKFLP